MRKLIPQRLAYSEAESAQLLGISVRTLFDLRKQGRIGYVPIGTRVIYPVKELQRFLDASTENPLPMCNPASAQRRNSAKFELAMLGIMAQASNPKGSA